MPCARLQGKNRFRELVSKPLGDGLHNVVAHFGVNRERIANVADWPPRRAIEL